MNTRGSIPAVIIDGVVTPFFLIIVFFFFFGVINITGDGTVLRSGVIAGNIDHGIYPELALQSYLKAPVSSCGVETELLIPEHMNFQDLVRVVSANNDESFLPSHPLFSRSIESSQDTYEGLWYACSVEYFSTFLGSTSADFSSHPYPWAIQIHRGGQMIVDVSDASAETIIAHQFIYSQTQGLLTIELTQQGILDPIVEVIG